MFKKSLLRLIGLCIFTLYCWILQGQTGPWVVTSYPEDIVKITYHPKGYKNGLNVSDAVILNPLKKVKTLYKVSEDTIQLMFPTKNVKMHYIETEDHYRGFSIWLEENEKIYGGGERALPLNRRGYSFLLDNNPWYGYGNGADNLNFSVPFFSLNSGYGVFFDNPSKGRADLGKMRADKMNVTFISGEINVYIIFGESQQEILLKYHKLTGKQGLPPRWALGNFMSRFGYTSEQQVTEIASKMQKENIPFDAIIFDLFWFGDSIKGTMGNLEWVNTTKWPDPRRMIADFKKQNIKTILITEPFILQNSRQFNASLPYLAVDSNRQPYLLQDFYFGKGGLIDIFHSGSKEWFWEKHHDQIKLGVAAWWGDLGEPEKHPKDLYHRLTDIKENRLFGAEEVHNIYGHSWTKMLFEKYAKYYPDYRLFSLNRSGFAGSQRYNIFPWSGDVSRSWSGLQAQLPLMLGMSMSGIPYIHSDAGGFAGGEGDYELYIRWLQFSSFTPIFRPHGTALFDLEPNAYSFPSEPALMPQPYLDMAKKVVKQRYRFLPYNYTLAYLHSTYGKPLVAPLYYYFPDDSLACLTEDQYMWGENIMIAPVIHKNQTAKDVYFPKGKWYPLNNDLAENDTCFTNTVLQSVPLEKTLAYAREGSFIPNIDKNGSTTEDYSTDSLTIHYYYSDKKSTTQMFDDDGWSKNSLAKNKYELFAFTSVSGENKIQLTLQSNKGSYSKKPRNRHFKVVLHGIPADYKNRHIKGSKYPENLSLDQRVISVVYTDKPITITILK